MRTNKMSYKDMAELFTTHNKHNTDELTGVIVFWEKNFKPLYRDIKHRSYVVSSHNNAWIEESENDRVIAYSMADKDEVMIFNVMPKMLIEYCYVL